MGFWFWLENFIEDLVEMGKALIGLFLLGFFIYIIISVIIGIAMAAF